MAPRVRADRHARAAQLAHLGPGKRAQPLPGACARRSARCAITSLVALEEAHRDEEGRRHVPGGQERKGVGAVVGVAVVEGDRHVRAAGRARPGHELVERHHATVLLEPGEMRVEEVGAQRQVARRRVDRVVAEHHSAARPGRGRKNAPGARVRHAGEPLARPRRAARRPPAPPASAPRARGARAAHADGLPPFEADAGQQREHRQRGRRVGQAEEEGDPQRLEAAPARARQQRRPPPRARRSPAGAPARSTRPGPAPRAPRCSPASRPGRTPRSVGGSCGRALRRRTGRFAWAAAASPSARAERSPRFITRTLRRSSVPPSSGAPRGPRALVEGEPAAGLDHLARDHEVVRASGQRRGREQAPAHRVQVAAGGHRRCRPGPRAA